MCAFALGIAVDVAVDVDANELKLTKYPQNNDKYSLVNDINNARILNVASSMRYNGPKAHNICRNRTVLLNRSCCCCCCYYFFSHSFDYPIKYFHVNELTE